MARLQSSLSAKAMFSSVFVLMLIAHLGECSAVTITKNGYSGIVVAFAPHISQKVGEPLLDQIKELFKNASVALYHATRNRAYFKDVTILVPQEWETRKDYGVASSEAFGQADIRIDEPNGEYGDGPYTLQPLGCEAEGLFIHLTPDYLKNLKSTSTKYFGDPGKTLVHEWAHLRYGIFDEFGDASNPMFPKAYYDDEKLVPNSCSNGQLEGIWKDVVNDGACVYNDDTGLPNEDCVFLPDVDKNDGITSSIASYHFLKNVFTFCDDGEEYYHDELPQNKHNVFCNSQSTWSVIKKHKDFQGNNNLPDLNITNLKPTFHIVQETVATYSLVLDISTSMNKLDAHGIPRQQILYDTVKRWLQEEVNLGSAVGIITFSHIITIEFPIDKITEKTKDAIIQKIPNKSNGNTYIGDALQASIKELRRFRKGPGGIIILITDGEENGPLKIRDVIPDLQASKARLVAIALHTQDSTDMEKAVEATNGKMFSIPPTAGTDALGMAFFEALTYQTREFDLAQKIHTQSITDRGRNYYGSFAIDKTIGNDTTIDFASTDTISQVTIIGPGVNDDIKNANENYEKEKIVRFKYSSLKEGVYYYNITRANQNSILIQVSVTSKAKSANIAPIITRSWVQQEPTSTPDRPRFVILAEVKQGNNPVINAAVMAKVDRPDKKSVILQLFDNGNGAPDITRNDGIYARYFTRFGGKGRYGVTAQVTDDGKASIRDVGFTGSRAMPATNKFQVHPTVNHEPTGTFARESSGGAFTVDKEISETLDIFPPSRISDLHVTSVSDDNSKVAFSWTAPGDDLDYGNASRYEIRYSSNWKFLKQNFTLNDLLDVDTTPQPAGETETITVALPGLKPKGAMYVAMVAVDKSNLTSLQSNIAVVSGSAPIGDSDLIVIIVGAVLAALVVVIAIIAAVMFHRRKKARSGH